MLLETEITTLHRVGLMPQAEDWRGSLAEAVSCLRRWVPSADTFGLWVSDYAKLCRLLNELNGQMEHLSWILSSHLTDDSAEYGVMVRAIDHAVDRIGKLTGTIDAELRFSAMNGNQLAALSLPAASVA
jgi:hypothetical protein